MTVHAYNQRVRRIGRYASLAQAQRSLGARAPGQPWRPRAGKHGPVTTWDDQSGERWQRQGGEWRLVVPGEPAEAGAEMWWQR